MSLSPRMLLLLCCLAAPGCGPDLHYIHVRATETKAFPVSWDGAARDAPRAVGEAPHVATKAPAAEPSPKADEPQENACARDVDCPGESVCNAGRCVEQ